MIKILKLEVIYSSNELEKRINNFLEEIRLKHHIYNTEIRTESGYLFIIISHSLDKMVY